MDIDPKTIKPAQKGVSDFFSWQLFRWMRKDRIFCEVWRWPNGSLHIGLSDVATEGGRWLHGRQLRNLCCMNQTLHRWAYPVPKGAKNVTGAFWADYMNRGVCAIHTDLVHDWNAISDDKRCCNYCGKVEHRRVEMRPVEIWEGATA